MKQPELGKKILQLRKQRGYTQEELVEQCNINVRTIQRIEAGSVTPRAYTIKAILDALGFNFEEVFKEEYVPSKIDNILGIKKEKLAIQIHKAFIFGIVFFIALLVEVFLSFLAFKEHYSFKAIYILVKFLSFISLFLFFRGFVIVSGFYKNYLLQISSFLIIIFTLFFSIVDSISVIVWDNDFDGVISFTKLITFGALSILFGISLRRLNDFGNLAKWSGLIEVITGVSFLAIILVPVGFVAQFLACILEIILFYKISKKSKEEIISNFN